jgi:hypothetical protein
MTTPELHERLRILCQLKHKSSPSKRITKIEKEIGKIKKELKKRRTGWNV